MKIALEDRGSSRAGSRTTRRSVVFGETFQLTQTTDPIGEPAYTLELR